MGSKRMMNDAVATQPLEELFRPSLKSPWIRIGIGVGALSVMVVVFALLTTAVWSARAWAMMSVLLIVSGALGYAIRRQIKIDKCPVLLTTKGIEKQNTEKLPLAGYCQCMDCSGWQWPCTAS